MKKMRQKVLSGNEYTKLGQSDEEIACQFSWQQNHRHGNDARRRLVTACFFCILFIVCEVTGGFMANSLAVMNDALHQVFDLSSLLMSLIASWIARWKPNENKTFGYHRAEILGACLVIVILWLLTGVLAYESLLRILPGQTELHGHVNSGAMIVTAAFAFVANLVIICVLNVHHSGHQCEPANITVRAAFLHTLGDVMHSFTVLVGAIIIKIKPSWEIADPILSLAGACIVLFSTLTVLRDSINILLEGVPFNIRLADVKKDLSRLDHVTSVHNVHVWSLTAGKTVLSAHLVANPRADVHKLLKEATCKMSKEYDFFHSCLQVEIRRPQTEHCFSKNDAKADTDSMR